MWSDSYRTPRYVWSTSAIAATALHAGLAWWGVSAWQSSQTDIDPAPIRVIALAEVPTTRAGGAPGVAAATPLTALPTTPAAPPVTPSEPAGSVPAAPAIAADPEPAEPLPPAPMAPWPPASPSNPAPVSPSPSPPPSPPAPTSSSPPSSNRPFPSTVGELSPNPESGVRSSWSLVTVPGGTDLPEELPRVPGGWAAATADVLTHSGCVAQAIAPGTAARVTLWPDIEADGTISGFTPWSGPENQGRETLIRCLESLAPQLPPLEPAREGGSPIPSYAMLLVVDVSTR